MISKPLVSVIIPAFNAQDYIAETLDSILAQSYKNVEIIVIDDGLAIRPVKLFKLIDQGFVT